MPRLEVIRLLASGARAKFLLQELSEVMEEMRQEAGEEEVAVYSGQPFGSDLLICIHWKKEGPLQKSLVGLLLAEYLARYGMVSHEIWRQELPGQP